MKGDDKLIVSTCARLSVTKYAAEAGASLQRQKLALLKAFINPADGGEISNRILVQD
jgi:hypothetical protein